MQINLGFNGRIKNIYQLREQTLVDIQTIKFNVTCSGYQNRP